MANLIPRAPQPPDFHWCDGYYNTPYDVRDDITASDCVYVVSNLMPQGAQPRRYYNWRAIYQSDPTQRDAGNFVGNSWNYGSCWINTESENHIPTGTYGLDLYYDIVPDSFREMALWVIEQCVQDNTGGFVTRNISNMIDYLEGPNPDLNLGSRNYERYHDPENYPVSATFFTLSIHADPRYSWWPNPGKFDPVTGGAIFDSLNERLLTMAHNSAGFNSLSSTLERIGHAWGQMNRTSSDHDRDKPWYPYEEDSASGATTFYECDAKLGNPKDVDCGQLQYSQLRSLLESLTLEPGVARFLNGGTCTLAISALENIVITRDQVAAALNDLVQMCVGNPLTKAIGGRAFYGGKSGINLGDGSGKLRKRDASAWNSVPLGAYLTLFQQLEVFATFPTALEEIQTFTWQKVISREDVRQCRGVHHHHVSVPPYHQTDDTCSTSTECNVAEGFVCALNESARVDGTTPSTFSCVSTRQWTPHTRQCRKRCLFDSNNTTTSNTTLDPVAPSFLGGNTSTTALIPEEMVCPCNCTYISHACCLSQTNIVWIDTSQRVNVSVQAPNGTAYCNTTTGLWVSAGIDGNRAAKLI